MWFTVLLQVSCPQGRVMGLVALKWLGCLEQRQAVYTATSTSCQLPISGGHWTTNLQSTVDYCTYISIGELPLLYQLLR